MQINLKNKTQEFQRIRLIPKSPESTIFTDFEDDNPTKTIDSDNILSVCLSPADPCEGAIGFANTGGIWGDYNIFINGVDCTDNWGDYLVTDQDSELHFKWINITNTILQVEIRNATLYENDYGWMEKENPTQYVNFENRVVKFCVIPGDSCIASPPLVLNTSQSIYKTDPSKSYMLYAYNATTDEFLERDVISNIALANDEYAFTLDDFPSIYGFYNEIQSDVELRPDTCNAYEYQGDYYVRQLVQTWENHHYIGHFYVLKDGVKEYLPNSRRNFEHRGTSTNLKDLLQPYYEEVASFLQGYGIDATYDPAIWGSYGTGGVKVRIGEGESNGISFGTDSGHSLQFEGYLDSTCVSLKTFEEIDNGPATLNISPISDGEPEKNVYTLLSSHIPEDPNQVNILTFLGITEDFEISSCFGEMPS